MLLLKNKGKSNTRNLKKRSSNSEVESWISDLYNFTILQELKKQNYEQKEHYKNVLTEMLKRLKIDKHSDLNFSTSVPEAEFIDENIQKEENPILPTSQAFKLTDEKDVTGSEAVTLFGMTVKSATTEELKSLMKPLGSPPPNPKFVFHNKIPKAGSTTMKWLLVALARKNGFRLDHARWCLSDDQSKCGEHDPKTGQHLDGPDGEQAMIQYIPQRRKDVGDQNFLLLKHHHWFNFSRFGLEEPTYINVVRDPVTRYSSWYYFERYGWQRQQGSRSRFFGDEEDKMRTLDECVQGDYPECLEPLQVLIKYFCGTDMKKCGMMNRHVGHDWTKVAQATERAKRIIVQNFYAIGVLEYFPATLALFEKMLPQYYNGAVELSQRPEQQKQRESSKSLNPGFSNKTRKMLETGVLRYEVDIYNLIKTLFYEKLKFYGIDLPESL